MILILIISLQTDTVKIHKKIIDPWFSEDKFHHFSYSFMLTICSYHFLHCTQSWDRDDALKTSSLFTISLGISKEIFDKYFRKTFISFKDLFYDFMGVSFAFLLLRFTG